MKQELIGCQSYIKVNCFHIFGAEKRLSNTVLGVKHWRSLCDADRNCLWGWWKWIKSARYSGWLVVKTLYVIRAILYWILSLIGNQWRRASIGVMCSHLPEPTTAWANEFWRRWELINVALGSTVEDTVAVINASSYQSTGNGLRGITVNESADVSKSPYVISGWAADTIDVLVEI